MSFTTTAPWPAFDLAWFIDEHRLQDIHPVKIDDQLALTLDEITKAVDLTLLPAVWSPGQTIVFKRAMAYLAFSHIQEDVDSRKFTERQTGDSPANRSDANRAAGYKFLSMMPGYIKTKGHVQSGNFSFNLV